MNRQNKWLYGLIIGGCFAVLAMGGVNLWAFRSKQLSRQYETTVRADFKRKDYQKTIEDATKLIQHDHNSEPGYALRASAYYHLGNYDKAISDEAQAICFSKTKKQSATHYNDRGVYLAGKKDWGAAIADYSMALTADPNQWQSYYGRGIAYYRLKRYPQALLDCNRAIEIKPDSVICYAHRSAVYDAMGDKANALADCQKALELKPTDATTWTDLGWAQYLAGDYAASIESNRRAIELDKSVITPQFNIALCLAMQNKAKEACQAYREAIAIGSTERRGAASKELQEAMKKHPDIPALRQAVRVFQGQ